jgi:hypothetical protein
MTAVEWFNQQLVDKQIGKGDARSWDIIFQQAKEMERKQIIDAYNELCLWDSQQEAEQYYNETFNK